MNRRFRALALVLTTLLSGAALGADPLQMEIEPAFEGFAPSFGTMPIAVRLNNTGADARGVLRVIAEGDQTDYPVELPHGTPKRLLTFPTIKYGGVQFELLTNRGNISKPFNLGNMSPDGTATALLIGDAPGEMSFLRGTQTATAPRPGYPSSDSYSSIQDAYTSPDQAPTRPVAYANIAAVVLGAGSERLSADSVEALKLFTLAGGTIIFIGGPSSPVLGDARWQDVLPVHDFHTTTLEHSKVLESLGESIPPAASITTGTAMEGAATRMDGSNVMTAERTYGLGKVVFLAFNPFEPPLSKWDGRKGVLTKTLRLIDSVRASNFLAAYHPSALEMRGASASYSYGPALGTTNQDPFSTTLPPTEKVFTILAGYFIVVVPLNFIVLRKLKRGELAWITAPLISLGFASAFFFSAQGLYAAKMSTATQGILLAQEGLDEGLFIGQSQLFVPRSGTYDLKLEGVDSLGIVQNTQVFYGPRQESSADLNPVDVGEIKIPEMQASNLAFKRVEYRQRLPVGKWFSLSMQGSGQKRTCTFRNDSAYKLDDTILYAGEAGVLIGPVAPGESKTVAYPYFTGATSNPSDLAMFVSRNRGLAVSAQIKGYRPGPQIGAQVDDRSSVRLAFIGKEALGPK